MKFLYCFIKTFKENLRDWKIIGLILVFAPFFVFMMSMYLNNPSADKYLVAVLNNDNIGKYSGELINEWKNIKSEDGNAILNVRTISDENEGKKLLKNKDADLLVVIPADFSDSFNQYNTNKKGVLASLTNHGDPANVRCMMATSFCDYTTFSYVCSQTGVMIPLNITFKPAGRERKLSEFDLYVPALLVMSLIMILFTAGATIVKEVEKDTISRLFLSKLSAGQYLGSVSLNQVIIGVVCMVLTYFSAIAVGYNTHGSILLMILISAVTCFSVISIAIIVTFFIRTMFGLLTVGCFPFFILMFFSDCFVPLPKMHLFNLFGNSIFINDILPTATATRAFNKILNYNASFSDILFELSWILAFSILYYFIGMFLFKKKYKY